MFNAKKIIIIVVIVMLAFVGYAVMISGKKKESASGVTKQSVSTTPTGQTSGTATLDGPGKEFVTQLLAIQNIKFNLQFFSDPVFRGLQDWSREIAPQESGRPNPFAPLESDIGQASLTTGFSGSIGSTNPENQTVAETNTPAKTTTKTTVPRINTSTR